METDDKENKEEDDKESNKEVKDGPPSCCFMDIEIGGEKVGRIIIELFPKSSSRACENFAALCMGTHGAGESGKPLHYKGTTFHRAVKDFIIQGGDTDGAKQEGGGESIFGRRFGEEAPGGAELPVSFKDDSFVVAMASSDGLDDNGSQFFITTSECPSLTGKHLVFGRVVGRESIDTVRTIENTQVNYVTKRPMVPCVISNCGQISCAEVLESEFDDANPDTYPMYPDDFPTPLQVQDKIDKAAAVRLQGNSLVKEQGFLKAICKYKQCLNYLTDDIPTDEEEEQLRKATVAPHLNLALCYLRLQAKKPDKALVHCQTVLAMPGESCNCKAHCRMALALQEIGRWDDAIAAWKEAAKFSSDDDSYAKSNLRKAKARRQTLHQQEQQELQEVDADEEK